MKFQKILLFLFFFFLFPTLSFSDHELGVIDTINARQVERLKEGNDRFAQGRSINTSANLVSKRNQLINKQKPYAILLSCSDSRVPPETIFDQGFGDLYVVRVEGNTLNSENIASIEYAVKKLDVHLIIVLGHDYCGAIQAAMSSSSRSTPESPHFERLITSVRKNILKGGGNLDPSLSSGDNFYREAMMNAKGVIQALLKESTFIDMQYDKKKTLIFPAVYSLESGKVEFGKID